MVGSSVRFQVSPFKIEDKEIRVGSIIRIGIFSQFHKGLKFLLQLESRLGIQSLYLVTKSGKIGYLKTRKFFAAVIVRMILISLDFAYIFFFYSYYIDFGKRGKEISRLVGTQLDLEN